MTCSISCSLLSPKPGCTCRGCATGTSSWRTSCCMATRRCSRSATSATPRYRCTRVAWPWNMFCTVSMRCAVIAQWFCCACADAVSKTAPLGDVVTNPIQCPFLHSATQFRMPRRRTQERTPAPSLWWEQRPTLRQVSDRFMRKCG